jgi:quinol monooxygenase YgiN
MENPIIVVAEFQAKPGHEAEAQTLLTSMLEPTREEEGCFRYDLHADADKPGHFFMIESWSSRRAVEVHLTKPHIARVLPRLAELAVEPARILFLNQIG